MTMEYTGTQTISPKETFNRLVGRVLGTLELANVDENVKKSVKAYIWQAYSDLYGRNDNGKYER